jgi:hypothetical protein
MVALRTRSDRRYIGDRRSMIVHDSWHENAEDCLMEEIIARGDGVGFDPDELERAFWEGFDYCDHCFDRSSPKRPAKFRTMKSHPAVVTGRG